MRTDQNRYNGVTVDETTLPNSKVQFKHEMVELIAALENKQLLWVKIPIEKSDFIPILTALDFKFHHCDAKSLMLVKKLLPYSEVPTAVNYTVGVGAIVRQQNKLLVVKDRFSVGYKLPGGYIDNNEPLKEALKREVFEETGVKVEFESIVNLGHFTQSQFNASNLYVVCTAKALTSKITIHDATEIVDAKWISVEEFIHSEHTNNYNKSVVKATLENKHLKLTEKAIKLTISGSEVFLLS